MNRRALQLTAVAVLCLGVGLLVRPGTAAPLACPSPEIHVAKAAGTLELLCDGKVRATYAATFGGQPMGPKEREGDERTPEGTYHVASKVMSKRFDRFLAVSYPNDEDKKRAKAKGITHLGGGIGIHGVDAKLAGAARAWTHLAHATGLHRLWGPTNGCVALMNEDVEALYDTVPVGTKIVIAP